MLALSGAAFPRSPEETVTRRINRVKERNNMAATKCDIENFVKSVEGKDHYEVLSMALKEATHAERHRFRASATIDDKQTCGETYAGFLKDLILYMRYETSPGRSRRINILHAIKTASEQVERTKRRALLRNKFNG
jgi:ribosomal protein L12E/L44/L45/RPP1/RPP2